MPAGLVGGDGHGDGGRDLEASQDGGVEARQIAGSNPDDLLKLPVAGYL